MLNRTRTNPLTPYSPARLALHILILIGLLLALLLLVSPNAHAQTPATGGARRQITADIVDVMPNPRNISVSTIAISFSAPVSGVDKNDLQLSWNGIPLDLSSTLLSGSGSSYTLSGLESLTKPVGSYSLTLVADQSGIQDARGNALAGDATDTWTMSTSAFQGPR